MSGIHAVLAGSSKPDVYVVPFTRGTASSNEGVAQGFYVDFGALTGSIVLPGNRNLVAVYENPTTPRTFFFVAGDNTGSWWTSVTVNGTTYTRAGATTPNGIFDGSYTYWEWPSALITWPASGEIYVI